MLRQMSSSPPADDGGNWPALHQRPPETPSPGTAGHMAGRGVRQKMLLRASTEPAQTLAQASPRLSPREPPKDATPDRHELSESARQQEVDNVVFGRERQRAPAALTTAAIAQKKTARHSLSPPRGGGKRRSSAGHSADSSSADGESLMPHVTGGRLREGLRYGEQSDAALAPSAPQRKTRKSVAGILRASRAPPRESTVANGDSLDAVTVQTPFGTALAESDASGNAVTTPSPQLGGRAPSGANTAHQPALRRYSTNTSVSGSVEASPSAAEASLVVRVSTSGADVDAALVARASEVTRMPRLERLDDTPHRTEPEFLLASSRARVGGGARKKSTEVQSPTLADTPTSSPQPPEKVSFNDSRGIFQLFEPSASRTQQDAPGAALAGANRAAGDGSVLGACPAAGPSDRYRLTTSSFAQTFSVVDSATVESGGVVLGERYLGGGQAAASPLVEGLSRTAGVQRSPAKLALAVSPTGQGRYQASLSGATPPAEAIHDTRYAQADSCCAADSGDREGNSSYQQDSCRFQPLVARGRYDEPSDDSVSQSSRPANGTHAMSSSTSLRLSRQSPFAKPTRLAQDSVNGTAVATEDSAVGSEPIFCDSFAVSPSTSNTRPLLPPPMLASSGRLSYPTTIGRAGQRERDSGAGADGESPQLQPLANGDSAPEHALVRQPLRGNIRAKILGNNPPETEEEEEQQRADFIDKILKARQHQSSGVEGIPHPNVDVKEPSPTNSSGSGGRRPRKWQHNATRQVKFATTTKKGVVGDVPPAQPSNSTRRVHFSDVVTEIGGGDWSEGSSSEDEEGDCRQLLGLNDGGAASLGNAMTERTAVAATHPTLRSPPPPASLVGAAVDALLHHDGAVDYPSAVSRTGGAEEDRGSYAPQQRVASTSATAATAATGRPAAKPTAAYAAFAEDRSPLIAPTPPSVAKAPTRTGAAKEPARQPSLPAVHEESGKPPAAPLPLRAQPSRVPQQLVVQDIVPVTFTQFVRQSDGVSVVMETPVQRSIPESARYLATPRSRETDDVVGVRGTPAAGDSQRAVSSSPEKSSANPVFTGEPDTSATARELSPSSPSTKSSPNSQHTLSARRGDGTGTTITVFKPAKRHVEAPSLRTVAEQRSGDHGSQGTSPSSSPSPRARPSSSQLQQLPSVGTGLLLNDMRSLSSSVLPPPSTRTQPMRSTPSTVLTQANTGGTLEYEDALTRSPPSSSASSINGSKLQQMQSPSGLRADRSNGRIRKLSSQGTGSFSSTLPHVGPDGGSQQRPPTSQDSSTTVSPTAHPALPSLRTAALTGPPQVLGRNTPTPNATNSSFVDARSTPLLAHTDGLTSSAPPQAGAMIDNGSPLVVHAQEEKKGRRRKDPSRTGMRVKGQRTSKFSINQFSTLRRQSSNDN